MPDGGIGKLKITKKLQKVLRFNLKYVIITNKAAKFGEISPCNQKS
jgi:hypothetical protein